MSFLNARMLPIILILLLTTAVFCQYKNTEGSSFERPKFSNVTKQDSQSSITTNKNTKMNPSATFKLFSHENYTLVERGKTAGDLNIENYYTVSLPAGAQSV
jgi:hypothetical protein